MHPISKQTANIFFKKIRKISFNKTCFDCGKPSPLWINLNLCVFLCTECAGKHRGYKKYNRMKSTIHDSFTENELRRIFVSGNVLACEYKSKNLDIFNEEYKNEIDARMEKSLLEKQDIFVVEEEKENEEVDLSGLKKFEMKKLGKVISEEEMKQELKDEKVEEKEEKKAEVIEMKNKKKAVVKQGGFSGFGRKNKKALVVDDNIRDDFLGLNCEIEKRVENEPKIVYRKYGMQKRPEKKDNIMSGVKKAASNVTEKGKILYNSLLSKFKK